MGLWTQQSVSFSDNGWTLLNARGRPDHVAVADSVRWSVHYSVVRRDSRQNLDHPPTVAPELHRSQRDAIARELGTPVKAIVRSLTDTELVTAQGQENSARKDLSFIERALFSCRLESLRFDRQTIMSALSVDESALSRLISVATGLPREIIEAIGPAPKIGRPRWIELADRLKAARALTRAEATMKTAEFHACTTDERFAHLLSAVGDAKAADPHIVEFTVDHVAIGSIKTTSASTTVRLDNTAAPRFGEFVAGKLDDLYREWRAVNAAER